MLLYRSRFRPVMLTDGGAGGLRMSTRPGYGPRQGFGRIPEA